MEKLQKALQQARTKRAEVGSGTPDRKAEPTSRRSTEQSGAWDMMPLVELHDKHLTDMRVVTRHASKAAMPFDILRTKILLQMRQNGWTRMAITSPSAACGKSTLSANLALGLGRQSELHSILFEFDLRRPSLAKILGRQPSHNIGELLNGDIGFAEQAMRLSPNVAACLCSAPVNDPSRYMLHDQTVQVLDQIEKSYNPDVMLFDMPPMLVGDDTRAFLRNVDCTLIVARAEVSTANQIDICEKELGEHTNVLGVVLNQCRHLAQDTDNYGYE